LAEEILPSGSKVEVGSVFVEVVKFLPFKKFWGCEKKQGMFDVGGFLDVLFLFGGWGDEGSYKFGSGMFGS